MQTPDNKFTGYQKFVIALLAVLQFTVVLDFMVLSPLGALLIDKLGVTTSQFGWVVSAYAFSAGAAGFIAAGFTDRFDRKKLLAFFYAGFMAGTLFCALAPNYELLLLARVVTGVFGGVIGSVSLAVVSDLFPIEKRDRVMGFVQMAFSASQVLGIPISLMLANRFGWHAPFWLIVSFGVVVGIVLVIFMKPVDKHLKDQKATDNNPFQHLLGIVKKRRYLRAFLATTLLTTGGFMLMPFGTAFGINNLGLTMEQLPYLYLVIGISSIFFGPLLGLLSDKIGKYKVFCMASLLSMVMVYVYTNLGITPLWLVVVVNIFLFLGISGRMISASALMTAIPSPPERGAFMSVNASIQQVSGGVASAMAGLIVVQQPGGMIKYFNLLGYIVIVSMLLVMVILYFINANIFATPSLTTETKKR